jgi:hypothetical protein
MSLPDHVVLPADITRKILNDICSRYGISREALLKPTTRGPQRQCDFDEENRRMARKEAMQTLYHDRTPPMAVSRIQHMFNAANSTVWDAINDTRVRYRPPSE